MRLDPVQQKSDDHALGARASPGHASVPRGKSATHAISVPDTTRARIVDAFGSGHRLAEWMDAASTNP